MREIKLWLPGETYWGARSTDGELFFTEDHWGEGFVLESDYAQLEAENERLQAELANSIPKPTVDVREEAEDSHGHYVNDVVYLNGHILDELDGELFAHQLRKALGITESGGEDAGAQ